METSADNAHQFNATLWQLEASHGRKGPDRHEQASGIPVAVCFATAELADEMRVVIKIQEEETVSIVSKMSEPFQMLMQKKLAQMQLAE